MPGSAGDGLVLEVLDGTVVVDIIGFGILLVELPDEEPDEETVIAVDAEVLVVPGWIGLNGIPL
ncbi:MAG: hypothetical protein E7Z63_00360 [Thermoplasmata archaeon]|nr:hypothetical protein [Thermoplasmata archaeon]